MYASGHISSKYLSNGNDSHESFVKYALKLEILTVTDLPEYAIRPFLKAWVFVNSADPQIPNGFSGVDNLERYTAIAGENAPQVTTTIRSGPNESIWSESFSFYEAVEYFQKRTSGLDVQTPYRTERRMVSISGKPLAIVVSVHAFGSFGVEETIGIAQIQDLRPGNIVDRRCPLYRSEKMHLSKEVGNPGVLHLKVEYSRLENQTLHSRNGSEAEYRVPFDLLSSSHETSIARRRGPTMISSPRLVTSPKVAKPSNPGTDNLFPSLEAVSLHQRNLVLEEEIAKNDAKAPLHGFVYENREWQVVEGFRTSTLDIAVQNSKKPVIVRCCQGSSSQITLHLHREAVMIMVEKCQNVRLIASAVSREIVVSNCSNLELLVGGSMPRILLMCCRQCTIVLWKDLWTTPLQSIGCSNIIIDGARVAGMMTNDIAELLTAPVREKILLPDMLITEFKEGTMTTQCDFSMCRNPIVEEHNGHSMPVPQKDISPQVRVSAPTWTERERSSLLSSSPSAGLTAAPVPRFGVGIILRRVGDLFKVEKLHAGGAACRDGRIKVGDVLVAIDGVSTQGKQTHEVIHELAGLENSKVLLSLNRSSAQGAMPSLHVILHRCHLEADHDQGRGNENPAESRMQELPAPVETTSREIQISPRSPATPKNQRRWEHQSAVLYAPGTEMEKQPSVRIENRSSVGVGLGIRPKWDGTYSVYAIVPRSSAQMCGKIQIGDIIHSIDGRLVSGKPYETVRSLMQGPEGTEVIVDFLRPEESNSWFQVSLTRGLGMSDSYDNQSPPSPPKQHVISNSTTSRAVERRSSVTPVLLEHKPYDPEEAVALALWLDEDFNLIAGDTNRKSLFSTQLAEDLAISLQTSSRRIVVVDLIRGVVADINCLPDYLGDARSPARLAAEIAKMANNPTSKFRLSRTTCKAWHAEVRGPVSQVQPLREVLAEDTNLSFAMMSKLQQVQSESFSDISNERAAKGIELSVGHTLTVEHQSVAYSAKSAVPRSPLTAVTSTRTDVSNGDQMHDDSLVLDRPVQILSKRDSREQIAGVMSDDLRLKSQDIDDQHEQKLQIQAQVERQRLHDEEERERQKRERELEERQRLLEEEERIRRRRMDDEEQRLRRKLEQEEEELRAREAMQLERQKRLDEEEKERRSRLDDEEKRYRTRLEEEARLYRQQMEEEEQERRKLRIRFEEEAKMHRQKMEEEEQERRKILEAEVQLILTEKIAQQTAASQRALERSKPEAEPTIVEASVIAEPSEQKTIAEEADSEVNGAQKLLEIAILSSRNLPMSHKATSRGCFCRIDFCGRKLETTVSRAGDFPDWNEFFYFDTSVVDNVTELIAEVCFWNQGLIGGLMIPAEEMKETFCKPIGWQSDIFTFTLTSGGNLVVGRNMKAAVLNMKFRVISPNQAIIPAETTTKQRERNREDLSIGVTSTATPDIKSTPPMPALLSSHTITSPTITPIRRVVVPRAANPQVRIAPQGKVGIGVSFQATRQTGQIVIVAVVSGSSAEMSNQVFPGDIIHTIDNVAVRGMSIPEVVSLIKGPEGTNVELELQASDVVPVRNPGSIYASTQAAQGRSLYASQQDPPAHSVRRPAPNWEDELPNLPGCKVVLLKRQPTANAAELNEPVGVGLAILLNNGVHVVSDLAPGGSAEVSGQVHRGDVIIEVDGALAAGRTVEQVIALLKGAIGTVVRIVLDPAQSCSPETQLAASMVSTRARPSSPVARNLGTEFKTATPYTPRSSSHSPGAVVVGGAELYTLSVTVRGASGLQLLSAGRPPRAVCKVRLLYPDWEPFHWASLPPAQEGLEPQYSGRQLSVTIPPARLDRTQLELTLWDELSLERSFMGRVVIDVRKFADPETTLGLLIANDFPLRQGGAFEARRPVTGVLSLAIRMMGPAR